MFRISVNFVSGDIGELATGMSAPVISPDFEMYHQRRAKRSPVECPEKKWASLVCPCHNKRLSYGH
jgi:hypothetical protein